MSQYGAMANFKIALRELPDHGKFRVTVRAAKFLDALLLDSGTDPQLEPTQGAITITELSEPQTIEPARPGIYQIDVHQKGITKDDIPPDGSRLSEDLVGAWPLDGDPRGGTADKEIVGRLEGEATFVESPFGQAISLDGNSGFVVIPRDQTKEIAADEFTVG